jgi:hypothetical protein
MSASLGSAEAVTIGEKVILSRACRDNRHLLFAKSMLSKDAAVESLSF